MVDHARDVRPGREHGLERPLDRPLHGAPVDLVLHARGERHLLEWAGEVPVLRRRGGVSHDLDFARIPAAQAQIVRQPDEFDRERVHAHQLRGHSIDGHLIRAGEDHVLHVRDHAARAGSVPRKGPVHHREDSLMNLLLDHQQVHQRFVDDGMGPVPVLVQQPAERVLHRACRRGEHVRLHRRQVDDVLPDEPLRDHESLRVHLVQAEELPGEVTDGLADVDPLLGLVDVDVPEPVRLDDVDLLVLAFAEVRIDHDRTIVAGMDEPRVVPVRLHRLDHAVELPGCRGAAGKEEMPGDVHLQGRIHRLRHDVLVPRQVHHCVVVPQHGGGGSAENGDSCLAHVFVVPGYRATCARAAAEMGRR